MTADAAALAAPTAKAERSARFGTVAGWLWSGALLALLAFLVLYPVAMLLLGALTARKRHWSSGPWGRGS